MCDYSLKAEKTVDAKQGQKLITTRFPGGSIGFADYKGEAGTAVCLRPGTEVAFAEPVRDAGFRYEHPIEYGTTAKFVQRNVGQDYMHHDYLEFPNGTELPVAALADFQRAEVLQLPADPTAKREFTTAPNSERRIEAEPIAT